MRVFIPTKGRAATLKTHRFLGEYPDWWLVVHNHADREVYAANPEIDPARLIVSGQPYGLHYQRQWITEALVNEREWFCFMDDNIAGFTALPEPYYSQPKNPVQAGEQEEWRRRYATPIDLTRLWEIVTECVSHAEGVGAKLVGWATVDNHYFRGVKGSYCAYIIGKCTVVQKAGLSYDPNAVMEDFAFLAENLLHFGCVLANRYVYPVAGHYEAGGMGTRQERAPGRQQQAAYIMRKYPGLFRYKDWFGTPGADLRLRYHNRAQVARWRKKMLGLE